MRGLKWGAGSLYQTDFAMPKNNLSGTVTTNSGDS
jgi:hypothetical protein